MKEDQPKRLGRFLKKTSPLMKSVSVVEFPLKEISITQLTYPDNPYSNVIHSWLHEKKEIDDFVKKNRKVFDDFQDPNMRAAVIKPRDFTYDWLEERKKARKRSSTNFSDEDEFEMALLDEEEDQERKVPDDSKQKSKAKKKSEEDEEDSDLDDEEASDEKEEHEEEDAALESLASLQKSEPAGKGQFDQAIRGFVPGEEGAPLLQKGAAQEPKREEAKEEPPALAPQAIAAEEEKTFEQGYQEGLALGEEQGLAKAQENAKALEDSILALKARLEAMPREMMEKSEKNFHDIASAICEALLEKKIDDEEGAFEQIVKKVVKQSFADLTVTVRISKAMFDKLSQVAKESGNWQADETLSGDEFKIEAEGGVVRSDVRKVVKNLLDNMHLKPFES